MRKRTVPYLCLPVLPYPPRSSKIYISSPRHRTKDYSSRLEADVSHSTRRPVAAAACRTPSIHSTRTRSLARCHVNHHPAWLINLAGFKLTHAVSIFQGLLFILFRNGFYFPAFFFLCVQAGRGLNRRIGKWGLDWTAAACRTTTAAAAVARSLCHRPAAAASPQTA